MKHALAFKPIIDVLYSAQRRPRVGQSLYNAEGEEGEDLTIEDYMTFAAAIADGLNMEKDYENLKSCIYDFSTLYVRLSTDWEAI